eukprot:9187043-Alexandrium_andersonii.AAC.1
MSASLVGSEMCIRDRVFAVPSRCWRKVVSLRCLPGSSCTVAHGVRTRRCLLYTSDAADDM